MSASVFLVKAAAPHGVQAAAPHGVQAVAAITCLKAGKVRGSLSQHS